MGTIDYQLRPAYADSYAGGVIAVGGNDDFDVGAALIAGGGTITVSDTDAVLVDELDAYPVLYRTGEDPDAPNPGHSYEEVRVRDDGVLVDRDGDLVLDGGQFHPQFQPDTYYPAGSVILGPAGVAVFALQAFKSGPTYDGDDWAPWTATDPTVDDQITERVIDSATDKLKTELLPDAAGLARTHLQVFTIPGLLEIATGDDPFIFDVDSIIEKVYAGIKVPTQNAPFTPDINYQLGGPDSGNPKQTIFTDQAKRPSVPAGLHRSPDKVPDVTVMPAGTALYIDVDGRGQAPGATTPSFVAGSDAADAAAGAVTSFNVSRPQDHAVLGALVAVGDLWVIGLRHNSADLVDQAHAPAGLTFIDTVGTGGNRLSRYGRIIDGTETANYTFVSATNFNATTIPRHQLFRGCDPADPYHQHTLQTGLTAGAGGNIVLTPDSTLTTDLTNGLLVYSVSLGTNRAMTKPHKADLTDAGYTARYNFDANIGTPPTGGTAASRHLATKPIAAAGDYGTSVVDLINDASAVRWFLGRLALKGIAGGALTDAMKGSGGRVYIRSREA